MNVTLIQKALRLCRGFWGNTPLAITSQKKGGKGRGVQVCAPRLPPNKQSTKTTPPPPFPFSLHYAQLLGLEATHFGRREKDGEGEGIKRQRQRYMKERGFHCGCDVKWRAKVVSIIIFSQISLFLFHWSVYSTTALQFLLQNNTMRMLMRSA